MIWNIISMVLIGLVAGFVARGLVPGKDTMSVAKTILLGIVGSFVGGFIGWALFGKDLDDGALQPAGIVGSIVGAVIALLVYNRVTYGSMTRRRHA